MIDTLIELYTKMTKLFVKEIPYDNEEYTSLMRYILDPDMAFYRQYGIVSVTASQIVFFVIALIYRLTQHLNPLIGEKT